MRFPINRELSDEFFIACQADDKPAAQVNREFMRAYVESHIITVMQGSVQNGK